jgi:hypothetical protein
MANTLTAEQLKALMVSASSATPNSSPDEIPEQVEFVPPSVMRIDIAQLRSRIEQLEYEIRSIRNSMGGNPQQHSQLANQQQTYTNSTRPYYPPTTNMQPSAGLGSIGNSANTGTGGTGGAGGMLTGITSI